MISRWTVKLTRFYRQIWISAPWVGSTSRLALRSAPRKRQHGQGIKAPATRSRRGSYAKSLVYGHQNEVKSRNLLFKNYEQMLNNLNRTVLQHIVHAYIYIYIYIYIYLYIYIYHMIYWILILTFSSRPSVMELHAKLQQNHVHAHANLKHSHIIPMFMPNWRYKNEVMLCWPRGDPAIRATDKQATPPKSTCKAKSAAFTWRTELRELEHGTPSKALEHAV